MAPHRSPPAVAAGVTRPAPSRARRTATGVVRISSLVGGMHEHDGTMAGAPKYGRCSEHTRKGGGAPDPLCRAMLYFGSRHTVPSAMRGCICTWHTEADAPHVSLACDCGLYGGWGPRIDVVCVSVRAALWGVMWTMVRGGRGLPLRLRGLFVDVVTRVCSAARARHPHSGSTGTARRVSRREGATASVSSARCRD